MVLLFQEFVPTLMEKYRQGRWQTLSLRRLSGRGFLQLLQRGGRGLLDVAVAFARKGRGVVMMGALPGLVVGRAKHLHVEWRAGEWIHRHRLADPDSFGLHPLLP